MTITFYVNWEAQEIYHTDQELVDAYISQCYDDDFRYWLDENYSSDIIFAFTESQKEDVEEAYRDYLSQRAQDWARDNNMEQEIKI